MLSKIILFSEGRFRKDVFGVLDQRQSSLNFPTTRIIHTCLLPASQLMTRLGLGIGG
jgi:hypothetical protein